MQYVTNYATLAKLFSLILYLIIVGLFVQLNFFYLIIELITYKCFVPLAIMVLYFFINIYMYQLTIYIKKSIFIIYHLYFYHNWVHLASENPQMSVSMSCLRT